MGSNKERKRLEKTIKARADKARVEQDARYVSGEKEEEQLRRLSEQMTQMQIDLSKFTLDGEMWLDMQEVDRRTNEQRVMSEIYQSRMLYMCAAQLRGGVTPVKLLSAVGMYMGMAAVNPKLRKSMDKVKAKALDGAVNWMERNPDKKILGMRGFMMGKFAKKRDAYMKAVNDGRMPFTPETAAMTDIVMAREAYTQMRDGKHDVDEVQGRYDEAREMLYRMAGMDGVSRDDIARSQRIIVGKCMSKDPTLARVFEESTFGKWQRSDGYDVREMVYDDDNKPHMETRRVWTGEYEMMGEDGQPVPVKDDAMFSVSRPLTEDDVVRNVADIMNQHDGAFDLENPSERSLARHNVMAAAANSVGAKHVTPDVSNPDVRNTYESTCASFDTLFDRTRSDWAHMLQKPGGETEFKSAHGAAVGLGYSYGMVMERTAMLYARYTNPDDMMTSAQAADISALSLAFVERVPGVSPDSDAFRESAGKVADWYAMMCVKDELGIPMDDTSPETLELMTKAQADDPRLLAHYKDIHSTMMDSMSECAYAVQTAIKAGNDPDRVMDMLWEAEDKGAQEYCSNSAMYNMVMESRINSRYMMENANDELFQNMADAMRDQYWQERARSRSAQADLKLGGIDDYGPDGPEYE